MKLANNARLDSSPSMAHRDGQRGPSRRDNWESFVEQPVSDCFFELSKSLHTCYRALQGDAKQTRTNRACMWSMGKHTLPGTGRLIEKLLTSQIRQLQLQDAAAGAWQTSLPVQQAPCQSNEGLDCRWASFLFHLLSKSVRGLM